jgi:hypothetical protein
MSEQAQADRVRSNAGTTTAVPVPKVPTRVAQPQQPAAKDRMSPDPAHHTDRYRLVTPFALRL